jgi:hypothetical protein
MMMVLVVESVIEFLP